MRQTADRPTWNRTKIFGSKGRAGTRSGAASEGESTTRTYPSAPIPTGHATPDTTRGCGPKNRERSKPVVSRFKSARRASGDACCDSCGWSPPVMLGSVRSARLFRMLHAHHVVPIAAGGKDHASNLVLLCPNHHAIAHALGSLTKVKGKKLREWTGPTTPEVLLNEIRWVEHDFDRWVSHCESGRDHQSTLAAERRAGMKMVSGGAA